MSSRIEDGFAGNINTTAAINGEYNYHEDALSVHQFHARVPYYNNTLPSSLAQPIRHLPARVNPDDVLNQTTIYNNNAMGTNMVRDDSGRDIPTLPHEQMYGGLQSNNNMGIDSYRELAASSNQWINFGPYSNQIIPNASYIENYTALSTRRLCAYITNLKNAFTLPASMHNGQQHLNNSVGLIMSGNGPFANFSAPYDASAQTNDIHDTPSIAMNREEHVVEHSEQEDSHEVPNNSKTTKKNRSSNNNNNNNKHIFNFSLLLFCFLLNFFSFYP